MQSEASMAHKQGPLNLPLRSRVGIRIPEQILSWMPEGIRKFFFIVQAIGILDDRTDLNVGERQDFGAYAQLLRLHDLPVENLICELRNLSVRPHRARPNILHYSRFVVIRNLDGCILPP